MSSLTSRSRPSEAADDLLQRRLDRLARTAPGRPELDDHRDLARENVLGERCVGYFLHASKCKDGRGL